MRIFNGKRAECPSLIRTYTRKSEQMNAVMPAGITGGHRRKEEGIRKRKMQLQLCLFIP